MNDRAETDDIAVTMTRIGRAARDAARRLARISAEQKSHALLTAADRLRADNAVILNANETDVAAAHEHGLAPAMLDRLRLDQQRVEAMASGLETIADLPDPVGALIDESRRPNGLVIQRVRVPIGVIGIIYESRPNVTADAAALCIKSGNAVILRGGSESYFSSRAIHASLAAAFAGCGLPAGAVQMVPTKDRSAVGYLLRKMAAYVDVVVPRGGRSLIARVQRDARIPVLGHLEGICHVFVERSADPDKAVAVVVNAKMRRTGICGAAETLLLDSGLDDVAARRVLHALLEAGCELRGDRRACGLDERLVVAAADDWGHEFLDAVIAVGYVDGVAGAIEHIERFGSGHTEAIVTEDSAAAEQFLAEVDSAIVMLNASTQFADGGEFGMGAEIGIATGRLHARGPVGAEQLTSYKYVVRGTGQTRA